jgi:hypothetical protein
MLAGWHRPTNSFPARKDRFEQGNRSRSSPRRKCRFYYLRPGEIGPGYGFDDVDGMLKSLEASRYTLSKVDDQVAAPTELGTPVMHRATIAPPRVRMEGWRSGRPGSNARNPREGKRKHTLDSYRPSHGRHKWTAGPEVWLDEKTTTCSNLDEVQLNFH